MPDKVDLSSLDSYARSCQQIANRRFSGLSLGEVAEVAEDYNAYPNLEKLSPPRDLIILEDRINEQTKDRARRAVLDGLIFWEHAAAGEATRLNLGPKYLIQPHQAGLDCELAQFQAEGESVSSLPKKLLPLTLGGRHMSQWAFEVSRLAEEYGLSPQAVMKRQKTLLIINEQSRDEICRHILKVNFWGLAPENFLFMVQPSFWGLTPGAEGWRYDQGTERRLHNHGQMAMQKTMEHQVFYLDLNGNCHYLSQEEFFHRLALAADLVSYNIEDLGYLANALDFDTIGLALALGDEGFGLSMEIVANNRERPVKGGLCAYDPGPGRDVVVESFRLKGLPAERISHLNKNFNHYPAPAKAFKRLHQEGLFMPIAIKGNGLYFQPVQGDINFLVKTAFISRREPAPLKSWKSPDDTPAALYAMRTQDAQPGFADFIKQWFEI